MTAAGKGEQSRQRFGRWSITVALIVTIGTLGVIVMAVSWYLMAGVAFQSTRDLVVERSALVVRAIEAEVGNHMDLARSQVEILVRMTESAQLNVNDEQALEQTLFGALSSLPQVHALVFINPDFLARVVYRGSDGFVSETEELHDSEEISQALRSLQRERRTIWGEMLFIEEIGTSVINIRSPVFMAGKFAGAFVAMVRVDQLSRYLSKLDIRQQGTAFILYRHDEVLAHQFLENGYAGLSDESPLPLLRHFSDRPLENFWNQERYIETGKVNFNEKEYGFHILALRNREYAFIYKTLTQYGDIPWHIGVYFDKETFSPDFSSIEKAAFFYFPLLFVLATLVFIYIGRRMSRPVHRLAHAADQVRRFPPDQVEKIKRSRLKEFDDASLVFNSMIDGLRDREIMRQTFGRYVPESIAGQILEDQGVLKPQSRIATIMFTDIVGFSALSEDMMPEKLINLLNRYFAVLIEPIDQYGGVIHQFQGDAVLATYNLPVEDKDHASNAIRSALAIQSALAGTIFEDGLKLHTRIGINTGYAVCGTVGAGERLGFTVHGDEVNLAARIEQLNKQYGTSILVSQATRDLASSQFRFEAMGTVEIRGRRQNVELYRVISMAD